MARRSLMAVLVAMAPIAFAERIEPPLEMLHDSANLLMAGTATEINVAASRVVFERKALLSGNSVFVTQDDIEVLVPPNALEKVVIGKDYVFGYTLFHEDPRHPGRLIGKRQGATLLVAPGLEPALFADTPALRHLIEMGVDEKAHESRALLALLLPALAGSDQIMQNLAANELAMNAKLRNQLGGREREAITQFVRNSAASTLGRTALLEAAALHPASFGAGWAMDTAAQLLATAPTAGFTDQTSDRETLMRTALLLFDQTATVTLPAATLQRWLRSDSQALVEPALRLVVRQGPADARKAIEQAAVDRATPQQTRIFLRGYLRRMSEVDPAHKVG